MALLAVTFDSGYILGLRDLILLLLGCHGIVAVYSGCWSSFSSSYLVCGIRWKSVAEPCRLQQLLDFFAQFILVTFVP